MYEPGMNAGSEGLAGVDLTHVERSAHFVRRLRRRCIETSLSVTHEKRSKSGISPYFLGDSAAM
jgi:hypothetical protein